MRTWLEDLQLICLQTSGLLLTLPWQQVTVAAHHLQELSRKNIHQH